MPEAQKEESYEKLLDRAMSLIPSKPKRSERFTMPEISSIVEGSRTMVVNFNEVSDRLNRDPKHLLRFFAKELATAGTVSESRAIFQGRFGRAALKSLLERYVRDFVVCPVCTRPDTVIERKKKFSFLICEACGATSSVKSV